jgi:PAS domain S-box-containing protein
MLEAELFQFLGSTADAAFVLRDGCEICYWSPSAVKLFGFTVKEAKGKSCFELLDGKGALGTRVCHQRCSVLEGASSGIGAPDFDLNVRTAEGKRIWVNLSTIHYMDRRTGRGLLVHLARNITARKHRSQMIEKIVAAAHEVVALEREIEGAAPVSPLSAQEIEILRRFAAGVTSTEVAKKLKISPQTMRNHLHHINQKLRTHNRLEAVMHAIRRGLI